MSDTDQIAAFLAKRGATKVEENATQLGYTGKDWRKKVRGEKTEQELINERHRVGEHVCNGLGEWIA